MLQTLQAVSFAHFVFVERPALKEGLKYTLKSKWTHPTHLDSIQGKPGEFLLRTPDETAVDSSGNYYIVEAGMLPSSTLPTLFIV